ncbi:glycosyltransferase [Tumidithrix elongata RA019]|uniref:Glycosyltransferase n=1 Tax=Tumidithrix elongata BACA0141 TaxID=2716417 RepID=A0AAW9PP04_9CYAN|nr:glycosyltransferase [Tumidithrix elongata RA019]
MFNIIVFSKDRPCQLELFLRSVKIFFRNWQNLQFSVLYTYSEPTYCEGYEKLKGIHPEFNYICEKEDQIPFKQNVLNLISDTSPYTLFFVDDNIFRLTFDIQSEAFQIFQNDKSILSLSLRLSPEITYCYSTNSPAPLPKFEPHLIWNWRELSLGNDWSYPMSLDGHVFRTEEIKPLIELAEFYNPNFLEEQLATSPINLSKMICYAHSKIANIPANRVQSTHFNRHGNLMTPAEFNREFLNGKVILLKNILDTQPTAVHQEIYLQLGTLLANNSEPKISIIISCLNQGYALPQIIESLWAQTYQEFEVLIIDRGSIDDTKLVAEALITAYPNGRIQLVNLDNEASSVRDRATVIAKGEHKLFLNPEQVISSTMLSDYLRWVETIPLENLEHWLQSVFYPWQKTQGELERSQCQLKSNLQQTQAGLEQSMQLVQKLSGELHQTQVLLEETKHQLGLTQGNLIQAKSVITAMESSKFWKLRNKWFDFRTSIGVVDEAQSVTPKAIVKFIVKSLLGQIKKARLKTKIIRQDNWHEDKPLVSVIIPCFNYGQYLEEAVDSVLSQTFQDFEIIIVDDGSDDPLTIKVLDELSKPKTQVIRQSNQKLPSARNKGIEAAQGKYICCLDADDVIKPTYLEKCLIRLETENLDICYSWIQEFGDSCEIGKPGQFDIKTLVKQNCAAVSSVFKREMWEKVGGYDPKMVDGYEDWNFWIAIAKMGAIGAQINEPLFLYRKHGSSMIDSAIEKHDLLFKQIQANHQELYSDRRLVKQISQRRQYFFVENGYVNLTHSFNRQPRANSSNVSVEAGNILFALPWITIGGADTVILQVIQALKDRSFNSTICTTMKTSQDMGDSTEKYEELTQSIYHLNNLLEQVTWKEFVFYLIESRKINIIFIAGSTYFYSILPDIKQRFPEVQIIDQLYNEFGHIENNRKYASYIDLNILANETIKEILLKKFGESESKTLVIVHGVDTEIAFNSAKVNEKLILRNNIIPQGKFIVSYMGRFSEEKCPQTFLQIIRKLKNYDDMYFVMIGNGPQYKSIQQEISTLNLEGKIFAPGFVDDNKPYLKISDALVIPSKIEGIPITLMEGLSLGIPIVASRVGGIPSVIADGYNGFTCNPTNVDEFVERIKQIYTDKKLQSQLKENARSYAIKKLDLNRMKNEYSHAFTNLLSQSKST